MQVTFHGVRGSCPCPGDEHRRYGGNTACVALDVDGEPPIVLDLGTGLRQWAATLPQDGPFKGTALLTHLHWDHVQGLPFFTPLHTAGAELDVWAPAQAQGTVADAFNGLMRPPYFPVQFTELAADIRFHGALDDDLALGNAKVKVRPVPHCGPTVGYRIDWDGASVAYVSDHQAPPSLDRVADSVLELCDGADLVIHDAQYTRSEFARKQHWGHCTVDYALLVAKEAGARRLALFHHDPAHTDAELDRIVAGARCLGSYAGVQVDAAVEGLVIEL